MLKKLILENWKSFRYAELPIDPLTVLIGTNASGKSNALEALDFLKHIASGQSIESVIVGNSETSILRGGVDWVSFKSEKQFSIQAVLQGKSENVDYVYKIAVEIIPKIHILSELLTKTELYKHPKTGINKIIKTQLIQTNVRSDDKSKTEIKICRQEQGVIKTILQGEIPSSQSILSHFNVIFPWLGESQEAAEVSQLLLNIFTLNPIPSQMRSYSSLSSQLKSDGSNIAGLLATTPENEKSYIEENLTKYLRKLPERDIQRVWAEPVGRLQTDAMLYCEEAWIPGEEPTVIDAKGMSDGTLRFLAILTALLTRPEGSQLVIEEVDNGLHPSRADLLLKMLREIGERRQIDVLVTTHNPALLNALEPEMLPFVIVAHRDSQTGESKLTPLEDLENLPKLMASGPLGKLAEQGSIERSLSGA